MATTRATKKKAVRKKKAASRRKVCTPNGRICTWPLCGRLEIHYRVNSIRLDSIDLFDPNAANPNDVWTTVFPPYTALAQRAAMAALRGAAVNGTGDISCLHVGCECVLSGTWGARSRWSPVEIHGGFSIPVPNPPPANLDYRANGTVRMRYRYQPGPATKSRSDPRTVSQVS